MEKLHTRKFVIILLSVTVVLSVLLCSILSWNEMRIRQVDVSGIQLGTSEQGVYYFVDDTYFSVNSIGEKRIHAAGWCVVKDKPTNMVAIHALVRDDDTQVFYRLPTSVVTRTDVTASFNDGNNYDYSGFSVDVKCNDFDIENGNYTLFILYEVEDETYLVTTDSHPQLREDV